MMGYIFARAEGMTASEGLLAHGLKRSSSLSDAIMAANPLLEAFGNARTVRNNNSSRFGKFTALLFSRLGKPQGARVNQYLLEASRVASVSSNERCFHIFYQLLRGAPLALRNDLRLRDVGAYAILRMSQCDAIEGTDDAAQFGETCDAMTSVGLGAEEILDVWPLVHACLLLGNVEFEDDEDDHAEVAPHCEADADAVADALAIERSALDGALLVRAVQATGRRSIYHTRNSARQARDARVACAKAIYSEIFAYLVRRMNEMLAPGADAPALSLGILDIYGFEIFELNSLEQLMINVANESLQATFIESVFVEEQRLYREEGIDWKMVPYSSNRDTLELITGHPKSVFALLDDQAFIPKGSDRGWESALLEAHGTNPNFARASMMNDQFVIKHYAGHVTYSIEGCVEKNRNILPDGVTLSLCGSANPLLAELFKGVAERKQQIREQATDRARPRLTLCMTYQSQLSDLLQALASSHRHYVRAIKPNQYKQAAVFEKELVREQLAYNGVEETIRVRKSGYPYQRTIKGFLGKYWMLIGPTRESVLHEGSDLKARVLDVMRLVAPNSLADKQVWQLGKTRVFIKQDRTNLDLERTRHRVVSNRAVVIQKHARRMIYRRRFKEMRAAAVIIQKNARRMVEIRRYERTRKLIIFIQACVRRWHHRLRFVTLRRGMTRLAACHRRRVAMREYADTRRKIYLIQAHAKRFYWSRWWSRARAAVVKIQAFARMVGPRCRFVRYVLEKAAATLIQARVRGFFAQRRYQAVLLATCNCQLIYRGKLAVKRYKEHIWYLQRYPRSSDRVDLEIGMLRSLRDAHFDPSRGVGRIETRANISSRAARNARTKYETITAEERVMRRLDEDVTEQGLDTAPPADLAQLVVLLRNENRSLTEQARASMEHAAEARKVMWYRKRRFELARGVSDEMRRLLQENERVRLELKLMKRHAVAMEAERLRWRGAHAPMLALPADGGDVPLVAGVRPDAAVSSSPYMTPMQPLARERATDGDESPTSAAFVSAHATPLRTPGPVASPVFRPQAAGAPAGELLEVQLGMRPPPDPRMLPEDPVDIAARKLELASFLSWSATQRVKSSALPVVVSLEAASESLLVAMKGVVQLDFPLSAVEGASAGRTDFVLTVAGARPYYLSFPSAMDKEDFSGAFYCLKRGQPVAGCGSDSDSREVLYQRFVEKVGVTGIDRRLAVVVRRRLFVLRSEHARLPLQALTLPGADVTWDGARRVEVRARGAETRHALALRFPGEADAREFVTVCEEAAVPAGYAPPAPELLPFRRLPSAAELKQEAAVEAAAEAASAPRATQMGDRKLQAAADFERFMAAERHEASERAAAAEAGESPGWAYGLPVLPRERRKTHF